MRYWTRGAFNRPVRITQKFWDELAEIRRCHDEVKEEKGKDGFMRVDTTFGTNGDDFWEALGPRPKYPQWMVDYVEPGLLALGVVGWAAIIGYIISEFF